MSNVVSVTNHELTAEQLELVKSTIAKGATSDELKLFLYRCKQMGLDPLKPGQIHFVKYGSNPGAIVVGIHGFRSKAASTGKHTGTKRGVIRDEKGNCTGAWCEVYRSDWSHPARDEVSMLEYNTGKAQWAKMPETMIKKVAEASALRIAFPDELGGIYSDDEMGQASESTQSASYEIDEPETDPNDLGEYVFPIGRKLKGKKLKDINPSELDQYIAWLQKSLLESGQAMSEQTKDAIEASEAYIKSLEVVR